MGPPDNQVSPIHLSRAIGVLFSYTDRMPNKAAQSAQPTTSVRDLIALAASEGIGPVLAARLLEEFGSVERVLGASGAALSRVRGVGAKTATKLATGIAAARSRADDELDRLARLGGTAIGKGSDAYPPLLAELPDAPLVLFVLGALDHQRHGVGIVGSRRCTGYGLEQAERFGSALAGAGLGVVSGGARGIDTAAHRGALLAKGHTTVVLGCGLSHTYPPENRALFEGVLESGGAIVSELPCDAPPRSEHFPSRNRLISGLSLGTLVIEAAMRSGALITARVAAEDHGREVLALPGRVDSPASAGTLDLLRRGGAQLVCEPSDVLHALEAPAFHADRSTHADRFRASATPLAELNLSDDQRLVLDALDDAKTEDQIEQQTGVPSARIRVAATMLEMYRLVRREGSKLARAGRSGGI